MADAEDSPIYECQGHYGRALSRHATCMYSLTIEFQGHCGRWFVGNPRSSPCQKESRIRHGRCCTVYNYSLLVSIATRPMPADTIPKLSSITHYPSVTLTRSHNTITQHWRHYITIETTPNVIIIIDTPLFLSPSRDPITVFISTHNQRNSQGHLIQPTSVIIIMIYSYVTLAKSHIIITQPI